MNIRKKLFALILILLLLVSVVACDNDNKTASKVWGTYSTVKVTRNIKESVPYKTLDATIDIQMMKNETEGAQFIVTTGDDAVEAYYLTVTDLTDGNGHTIPKADISVYHQKYIQVASKTDLLNNEYIVGDYVPDMLLPLDTAKEHGENNIEANSNQGVTIEVKTTSETVPGTYKGTFVLDLDGETTEIPVTVEVWDIEYVGRRTFMSCFLLYRNCLIPGEYEASEELVDRYIDFFLDYKMDSYIIQGNDTVKGFVEEAVRLWKNNNYNSICIPKAMSGSYNSSDKDAEMIIDCIVEMAKLSTPEDPYIDAVYIYPSYYDEVDAYPDKYDNFERIFNHDGEWDKTLRKALNKVKETEEYQALDDEFKAHIDEAVLNIPAVNPQTTFKREWIESNHITFCPILNLVGEDGNLQIYQDYADINHDGDVWGYTCIGPRFPNPTFHIDDYNLGTRVSGWMCKKFDLDGYLYWATNAYQALNTDKFRYIDVYETAERASYCAGDGYLVYPGAYYGSEYPFPSIRLVAWRDAMDDYDMLEIYENLLKEKAAKYGIKIDFADYVNDLYDTLFADTSYYTDDAIVFAVREELAKRILALKGTDNLIVKPEDSSVVVYSTNAKLTIDGVEKDGVASNEGFKYVVENATNALKNITIKSTNGEYKATIRASFKAVEFKNDSIVSKISEASSVAFSEGQATVNIVSVLRSNDGSIDGATQRFVPQVEFSANVAKGSAIIFTIDNTGDAVVNFTLSAVLENGTTKKIGTGFVLDGATREYRYDFDTRVFTDELLSSVKGLRFEFANVNEDNTALEPNKTFTISNVVCEIGK